MPGARSAEIRARAALIDVLEALGAHRDAVVLIGAQAIYLQTGEAPVALAPFTKDTDLALDARALNEEPRIERAMVTAGFVLNAVDTQPGSWISQDGIPVDLMVPEALSGRGGRRGARIPPHAANAARRAVGLEAAVVDNKVTRIDALDPDDPRSLEVRVAGPAALLVSKLHKLGERLNSPGRLLDKDAHDVYRLLAACPTRELAHTLARLGNDDLATSVTCVAIELLEELFGRSPEALGSQMAGRAETGIGAPATVAASVSLLAADLLTALRHER